MRILICILLKRRENKLEIVNPMVRLVLECQKTCTDFFHVPNLRLANSAFSSCQNNDRYIKREQLCFHFILFRVSIIRKTK
jgi:hypothetical protein